MQHRHDYWLTRIVLQIVGSFLTLAVFAGLICLIVAVARGDEALPAMMLIYTGASLLVGGLLGGIYVYTNLAILDTARNTGAILDYLLEQQRRRVIDLPSDSQVK